jgi:hypothetical protein
VCEASIDGDDNFCRRCGVAIQEARLPAVRPSFATTVWQPAVSPVVKGAAVMAAGTVGQFLFRRAVSSLLSGASRPRSARAGSPRRAKDDGMVDDAQIVTEMVMMRRVRLRRQA